MTAGQGKGARRHNERKKPGKRIHPAGADDSFGDSGYTDACGGSSFSESDQLRQAGGGSGRGADYGGCGPALYPGPTGGRGAEGQRYSAFDQPA